MKQGENHASRNTIVLLAAIVVVSLLAIGLYALSQSIHGQSNNPGSTTRLEGDSAVGGIPVSSEPSNLHHSITSFAEPIAVYHDAERNIIMVFIVDPVPAGQSNHFKTATSLTERGPGSTVYTYNDASVTLRDDQQNLGVIVSPNRVISQRTLLDEAFVSRVNANILCVDRLGGDDPSGFIVAAFEAIRDYHGEYPANYVRPTSTSPHP